MRAALLDQAPGGLVQDMHRVDSQDPALEVQLGGQSPNDRDLVALVRGRFPSEHVLGPMLHGRHEMVLAVGVLPGGAADAFAVDGDGLGGTAVLRRPGSCCAVQDIRVKRDEDVEERGRGERGEAPKAVVIEGASVSGGRVD